jgi:hypothetical protein
MDDYLIRELEKFVVNGMIQLPGQGSRQIVPQEVRAGRPADHQRAAGEQGRWYFLLYLGQTEADVFGRVAGGGQHANGQIPERDDVAILQSLVLKAEFRLFARPDLDTGLGGQLPRTADEIVMQVGVQRINHAQTQPLCDLEITIDVALRVQDCRLPGFFGSDQIR